MGDDRTRSASTTIRRSRPASCPARSKTRRSTSRARNFERRKHVLEYDDVNQPAARDRSTRQRREGARAARTCAEKIHDMIEGVIDGAIALHLCVVETSPTSGICDGLRGYPVRTSSAARTISATSQEELNRINAEDIRRMLLERADALYNNARRQPLAPRGRAARSSAWSCCACVDSQVGGPHRRDGGAEVRAWACAPTGRWTRVAEYKREG